MQTYETYANLRKLEQTRTKLKTKYKSQTAAQATMWVKLYLVYYWSQLKVAICFQFENVSSSTYSSRVEKVIIALNALKIFHINFVKVS